VEPNELTPELAQTFSVDAKQGVIITGVLQNGPAAKAGIRPGDVVTTVAGQETHSVAELLAQVAALKPGSAAPFEVQRADGKTKLQVTPGVRPKPREPQ
jgi:S1-C subfamily serine protease